MPPYGSPGSPYPQSPGSSSRRHLETQHAELQRRYDTLTQRLAAVDTDIDRELDSERKFVLQARRADLAAERNQVDADMERIELQLAGSGTVTTDGTASASAQTTPTTGLLPEDRASLERQLADQRENLRLVEERKAAFVQETDIPLQLVRDERHLRERIAELKRRLGIG